MNNQIKNDILHGWLILFLGAGASVTSKDQMSTKSGVLGSVCVIV